MKIIILNEYKLLLLSNEVLFIKLKKIVIKYYLLEKISN